MEVQNQFESDFFQENHDATIEEHEMKEQIIVPLADSPNSKLCSFDWSNKWLKGDEYAQMLLNIEGYCTAYKLQKYDRKTHPESIYKAPENGMIYFVEGNCVGSEFGFPRVPFRKQYRWKKMNFTTDLPKKRPRVTYIVASSVKCSKAFNGNKTSSDIYRMHAVILYREDKTQAAAPEISKQYILCHIRRIDVAEASDSPNATTKVGFATIPSSSHSDHPSPKIEEDDSDFSQEDQGTPSGQNKAQSKSQLKQIEHLQQFQNQFIPLRSLNYNQQQTIPLKSQSPFENVQKKKRNFPQIVGFENKISSFPLIINPNILGNSSPRHSHTSSSSTNQIAATLKDEDNSINSRQFLNLIQPHQFSLPNQIPIPNLQHLLQTSFQSNQQILPQGHFPQPQQQYALQLMLYNLAQQQLEQERLRQQELQSAQEQSILNLINFSQNNMGFQDLLCQLLSRENASSAPDTEIDYLNLFSMGQATNVATPVIPNLLPLLRKDNNP